jgi:putative nucleotidyltransferase with HDIG domain
MMIDRILKSIEHIPAFPATIQKVVDLLHDDDYRVADVVEVIGYDPAIAANILRISNSAYFGVRQKVRSIHDAVVYLGQQQLIRAVQTAGISKFYQRGGQGYVTRTTDLWEHAVAVAIMSQILSRRIRKREDPSLYTAALLHDIGKIILGEYVQQSFSRISHRVNEGGCSFLEAEEEILGINHAQVGGWIASHWHFPAEIKEAIAYHHRPDLLVQEDKTTVWLVYLADQACLMLGLDGGADGLAHKGLEEVMGLFDFRAADLEKSLIELHDALGKAKDLLHQ